MTEAAFFDLDKTVIAKAAMLAFGPRLHKEGMLNRWLVVRALWGQVVFRYLGADEGRMVKMRETALKVAAGWEKEKISNLVDGALTDVIDPLVYTEAVELIESHQEAGRRVYLVSASPEEIVMPLARHLGVDAAIASRAKIDAEGRYTGEVEFYSAGEHKVARSYVLYREERARERQATEEEAPAQTRSSSLNVVREDGSQVALDEGRLRKIISEACTDIDGADGDAVFDETLRSLFDGVAETDVARAATMSARVFTLRRKREVETEARTSPA